MHIKQNWQKRQKRQKHLQKHLQKHGGVSQRQFKVGEEIRHILAAIILRGDLYDPNLADVSITLSEVVVSADFSQARVYFTALHAGGDTSPNADVSTDPRINTNAILKGLERIQPALQHKLSKRLTTKRCPRLKFFPDTRFEVAGRIDALIAQNRT